MFKFCFLLFILFVACCRQAEAHEIDVLKHEIERLINAKKAVVGVSIKGGNAEDSLSINGQERFPMQSVFKFHIALAVLAQVDKGNLSLEQDIRIKEDELLPGLWSPIRKKYPKGTTLTLSEVIKYTVALSDNVGCDVLLKLLGEPQDVEKYIAGIGFSDFEVKINEKTMQSNWDMQYLNWTTPDESNRILQAFFNNRDSLLSDTSHNFIWDVMKSTKTGRNRLRGQLPEATVVAHKTGWSGKHQVSGVTAAVNNVGVIFLPNGEHFYISVFVTDSTEDFETNEKIISDIAKAAWDYFSRNMNDHPG